jgi:hypothetical protein
MAYEPNKIEIGIAQTAPPQTRVDGIVIRIEEGKVKDFYSPEQLAKFEDRNPEAPAINVVVEHNFNNVRSERSKTITLPPNNKAHPKSSMAKWIKQYTKPPEVGQKVTLIANEKGYFEILC